ncbi:hypothetical protein BT63DRAFT_460718 [Microthyrium microscopicum]|uniref:Uncharacterized protein n=1 Tax=Microthyrium microscopicum TaxID=703497 RepID=A0A6A6TWS1_9PEZI|nr:hypothetical protein BT63DRAFT_460718 [Microthyrium microscopicum]
MSFNHEHDGSSYYEDTKSSVREEEANPQDDFDPSEYLDFDPDFVSFRQANLALRRNSHTSHYSKELSQSNRYGTSDHLRAHPQPAVARPIDLVKDGNTDSIVFPAQNEDFHFEDNPMAPDYLFPTRASRTSQKRSYETVFEGTDQQESDGDDGEMKQEEPDSDDDAYGEEADSDTEEYTLPKLGPSIPDWVVIRALGGHYPPKVKITTKTQLPDPAELQMKDLPVVEDPTPYKDGVTRYILLGCKFCDGGNCRAAVSKNGTARRLTFISSQRALQEHLASTHGLTPSDEDWKPLKKTERGGWDFINRVCNVGIITEDEKGSIVPKPVWVKLHPSKKKARDEGTADKDHRRATGQLPPLKPRKKRVKKE